MTGLSMGGIGAASIPLHHPDVFAAAAPLCGYHSYFVRRDTEGVRRPWELFLMQARSNAEWAENGLHLPLYVVHGTQDRPVENSRVLVDRYTALHYRIESEWPDLGHNVWSTTYAGGRIVPYFLQFRRDPTPRHVRFRTPSTRWRQSYWVAVDRLASRGEWGSVDAEARRDGVRVEVHGVSALSLSPPASFFDVANPSVRIGGDTVALPSTRSIALSLGSDGHWREAARSTTAPIGPVRDVFDRPIAVVYGAHDRSERAMDLRVARAWARVRHGVRAHIAVMTDDAVTDEIARTHALVLVGTERGNSYLARIASRLPIHADGEALRVGTQRFAGPEVGATFVAANPEAPEQTVVVVTGTTALGVWRSRSLPDLVPDFLVYDAGVANARGRVILGEHAHVLAGGFWTSSGDAPAQTGDSVAAE
jgi:hypothetical protein